MNKKEEFVKICPKCGSDNVTTSGRIPHISASFSYCKFCRYEGIFPEVEKSKIEEFRKMIRRKNEKK